MLSVEQMASRLLVMNSYVTNFHEPEDKDFTTGDMIEIILCMIPKDWITCMTKAGMEPRSMTYQALIDHLVTLDTMDTTSSQHKKGASGGSSKGEKRERPGKGCSPYKKN